ncbi:MAG: hypothetical protein GEV06_14290 [Luteitalea sp.]|nr:hypothetical protein [Luteitalea sp.]
MPRPPAGWICRGDIRDPGTEGADARPFVRRGPFMFSNADIQVRTGCALAGVRLLGSMATCLLLIVMPLFGQGSTGTITGVVTDPSHAHLPGVDVVATNVATGVSRSTVTNAQGEYTIPLLQPGEYQLTASLPSFRAFTRSGLVVELGRVIRLDMALELGEVTDSVEVRATTPLLESETSSVGQFIENETVINMPLNARRAGELISLMGNAITISKDVLRPRVAAAGGRGDQQQWMIDGVNASNIALEIPQALFNPPVEAVQEMRVQQNAYSAELGNSAGGVVTISTKSGTNEYRGGLYEFLRNDALDARNFFAADKAPLRWNVFGAAMGGPIIRNRTFFFVHNEWQRQRIGVTNTLTVPTELQRSGDFSQTTDNAGALTAIYDPLTAHQDPEDPSRIIRDPFPNNVIPEDRFDPVGATLVEFYPLPNQAPTNPAGANNFVGNRTNALNLSTLTAKVDHTFSDTDRFAFRFILHDFPTNNTPVFSQAAADPFGVETDRRAYSFLFNHLHNFSPTLLNDLRVNYQPRRFQIHPLEPDGNWPAQLGLNGVNGSPFPRVNAAGFVALGNNNQGRVQAPITDTHIVNTFSWFRKSHALKLGGEIRLSRNQEALAQSISGNLTFQPQGTGLPGQANTGNAIASLLLGYVHRGRVAEFDILDRRANYFALFVQDDWKVTPTLTVNLGIRWEAHTPRVDANDRQNGFDPVATNPVSGTPGVVTFAGRDGLGRTVYDGDYNNIGPRIGLAWRPFGSRNAVIRSGYGIFYGPPLPGSNNTAAGFGIEGDLQTPDNGITAPFLLRDGFPASSRLELGPGFGAVPVGEAPVFSPEFIDKDRRLGYSHMFNLSIQGEIGFSTMVELSYLGNLGRNVPGPSISINQVPPDNFGPGNRQALRPFPQFNDVTRVSPMDGTSSYHGMNIKVEKRFSHGLNFLANYTWSKFIDDVPAQFEAGSVGGGPQNLFDRASEKALSGNDVRHRLVWSSVYMLPFGKGRATLNEGIAASVLGGWDVGLIMTLQAGNPIGLVTQVNTTNGFTPGPQRVNVLRDPSLPTSERTVERYFDTEAVVAPPELTFGNAGRSLLTGPGLANFDVSLIKNHRWGQHYNVQFRIEAFNVFNHPNFNNPGRALGSPNFGVISSAGAPREVQLGLKVEF